jgi:hypothetical protein
MTPERFRWDLPEMILIAGDGRNVGKTTFAKKIISTLALNNDVIALKTSPHFHSLTKDQHLIERSENYIVSEERAISDKDSSLFLQAGAKKVFFIMAGQEHLEEAFAVIIEEIRGKIILAESGGLNEFVKPGIFFFIKKKDELVSKKQYLAYDPCIVSNAEWNFDFHPEQLIFSNGKITYKTLTE